MSYHHFLECFLENYWTPESYWTGGTYPRKLLDKRL